MATITQSQLEEIFMKADASGEKLDRAQIVQELVNRGNIIEGLNDPPKAKDKSTGFFSTIAKAATGFLPEFGSSELGKTISAPTKLGAGLIGKGVEAMGIPGVSEIAGGLEETQSIPENAQRSADFLKYSAPVAAGFGAPALGLLGSAGLMGATGAATSAIEGVTDVATGASDQTGGEIASEAITTGVGEGLITGVLGGAGKLAGAAISKSAPVAEKLYQGVLKPSKALRKEFPNVVKTGLENGIIISRGSADDVLNIIDDIDGEIGQAITQAGKDNVQIPVQSVVQRTKELRDFFKDSIGGGKMVDELDGVIDDFVRQTGGGTDKAVNYVSATIPAKQAQILKQNTQKVLRKAYGELKTADKEGKKQLARGLREELEARIPEIGSLNKKLKDMIGLEKALVGFADRTGNHDLFGLSGGVGFGVGAAEGGLTRAVKGGIIAKTAKSILANPQINSALAIQLYKMSKGAGLPKAASSALRNAAAQMIFESTTE